MSLVRVRAALIPALLAVLIASTGSIDFCAAQEAAAQEEMATPETLPGDVFVREDAPNPNRQYGALSGFSGYGATFGLMRVFGGDLAKGAAVRPVMQASFRYRFDESWIGVGDFGFGYNAFADRGDTVYAVNFGTLGALRKVGQFKGSVLRVGGGAGLYRWNYKWHGSSVRDPITQRFYRGYVPGLYLSGEDEMRLTRHVTVTGILQTHYVFTADDKFERLFDSNHPMMTFRVGLHYHFSPDEGILWERKENTRITLESGKAGQ